MSDSVTPWTAALQPSLSFTISENLLKLMSIELVMSSNHVILCHPLLFLPSIFPSIKVFSNELSVCIRWSQYWSFSFSIVLPKNIQGLFLSGLTGFIPLVSKGLSGVFSSTMVWKNQFCGAQPSLQYNSYIHHDYWKNHSFAYTDQRMKSIWFHYYLVVSMCTVIYLF